MNHRVFLPLLAVSLMLVTTPVAGQSIDVSGSEQDVRVMQHGRHALGVGLGMLPASQANPSGVRINGFVGSLSYTHWPAPDWGINVGFSMLDVEARPAEAASVMAVLIGASYYPDLLSPVRAIRPYLSAAIGPYIGFEASGFRASAETQSVMGTRVGAGIDAFVSRWLRLGMLGAYHIVPDFGEPVGTIQNASGAQMSFEVGVAFGRR